jgi:ABC-2 type transport system permease protein
MKNRFRHIWYIALKDLRLFITDRMATIMFILFPFLFIIMFNILLANVGVEDKPIVLRMATQETGGISQQIIQSMETKDENLLKPGEPRIVWEKDYNQAKADVESGKMDGFLAFPSDFTQGVQMGYGTNLEIVALAEATNTRMALNGLAESIIARIGAQRVEMNAAIALMVQQSIEGGGNPADIQKAMNLIFQSQGASGNEQPLISYKTESAGQIKPFNPSSYVIPGYLVMFVFFAAALSAVDIIRERRNHTLERLLASSVRKESILGGIYLGAVLKGLLQIVIFWTAGILIFHVDVGISPWAVIVLSLLMAIMSAAFTLMMATLVKTERSASAIGVLVSLLLAPLGGCWWPLFIEPQWMQFLARFTPHGWANIGFNKLMVFGADGSAVIGEMLALVGFALIFIIIAILKFRTSSDPV